MPKFLISTGDHSADIHAASLAKEILKQNLGSQFYALGGERLKSCATFFLEDLVGLDVSGFTQPIKQFFKLKGILENKVFPLLDQRQVQAVILVDYYGFNIHIAKRAQANGIPVYYFVAPQVWASRKHRIKNIKKYVTKVFVIFPFEEKMYREHQISAQFVGHPLWEEIRSLPEVNYAQLLQAERWQITLLPGSRKRELIRHIPTMIQTYQKLKQQFPKLQARMLKVDYLPASLYHELITKVISESQWRQLDLTLERESQFNWRRQSILALAASGTVTLENAFLGLPSIVFYQMSPLTYLIAKRIIQVPYISMPNILANRRVVPEMVQFEANPAHLFNVAKELFAHPQRLIQMHQDLRAIGQSFNRDTSENVYAWTAKKILGDNL